MPRGWERPAFSAQRGVFVEIRAICPEDDRLAVSRVYEESWRYAYRGIVPQDYLDGIPRGRWACQPDEPGLRALVLTEGGEIAGVSSFGPSRFPDLAGWGEVVSLYLLPEYMGKGYGARLLSAALEELKGMGFREAFLWTLKENRRARRFYERQGFRLRDETVIEIGGAALKEVQYCRGMV